MVSAMPRKYMKFGKTGKLYNTCCMANVKIEGNNNKTFQSRNIYIWLFYYHFSFFFP